MEYEAEHRIQAQANPVFVTAKTAVCLMEQAGIPDAGAIARSLGLDKDEFLHGMADFNTVLGNALVVEAKYRTGCSLIEDSGYHVSVDLPCGYTPKALRMTEKGMRFVGLDLPIVAEEVDPILRSLAKQPERMSFHGIDATNFESLSSALRGIDEPVCITTEGMMMYFTDEEVDAVISNIRGLLEEHGGCWITPDPEFALQFALSFRSVFGESSLAKLESARETAQEQSNVVNRLSNSFILDATDVPKSLRTVETLLQRHGLKAERVSLAEHMPELNIYRKLTPDQILQFKEAMRQCHFWIITLDDTRKRQEESAMQKNQAFGMSHTVKTGNFQMALRGRVDSLSAPRILEAWESEKSASAIERAEIDCSNLEYISSAGVRVLLVIKEECNQGMVLLGVNASVAKALAQKGFTGANEGKWTAF